MPRSSQTSVNYTTPATSAKSVAEVFLIASLSEMADTALFLNKMADRYGIDIDELASDIAGEPVKFYRPKSLGPTAGAKSSAKPRTTSARTRTPSLSRKERVRQFLQTHGSATAREITEAVGAAVPDIIHHYTEPAGKNLAGNVLRKWTGDRPLTSKSAKKPTKKSGTKSTKSPNSQPQS